MSCVLHQQDWLDWPMAIEWRLKDGKREIEKPKKTWQDTLKEELEVMGMDWSDKTTAASDRANWRRIINGPHGTGGTKSEWYLPVIWAKLTWRAIAALLPPGQSCTACNKIIMCLEGVHKCEASVQKARWI